MTPHDRRYQRIVAAVDFDPWSEDDETALNLKILDLASALALAQSTELVMLHVWTPATDRMISVFASDLSREDVQRNLEKERRLREGQLEGLARRLRERLGEEGYGFLAPRLRLAQGDAAERIPVFARDLHADLVVMGTLARTGVPGLIIGNTAEVILGRLKCAVLAVKPDGFQSPVQALH